ncbi:MAG: acetylornithine deacetylase [Bauldia litoralis]
MGEQATRIATRGKRLLADLVGFDTVSHRSNLDLIAYIESYFKELGVATERVYNEEMTKANLFATIGPETDGGLILSGHVDVVPVEGQAWTHDPFDLIERDGRLFGRGSCDMKGFVAMALAAAPEFQRADLKRPIHFAISYDEEVGCIGVRGLIGELNGRAMRPAMCIVGEPTSMQPVVAHKGKWSYRAEVTGLERHSSLAPQGVNAVEYAAEAITFLRRLGREKIASGARDEMFDLPHTTVHVGVVAGGSAVNIVPNHCNFDFEWRYIPADRPEDIMARFQTFLREELEPEMKAIDPACGFTLIERSVIPGLEIDAGHEVVRLAKACASRNDHGKVAYGTEAGLFQELGQIPTVVCGPGDIAQAHRPDEFIALEQIDKAGVFFENLVDRWANA